jgi:ABC-type sugar transport system permease subunit
VSVVTTAALWILDTNFGIANYLFGSAIAWFQDPTWAMPAVAAVTVWWTVGFNMLLFLAGLQNISPDVYEAASIDGANAFKQFIHITCPLIWPVTSLASSPLAAVSTFIFHASSCSRRMRQLVALSSTASTRTPAKVSGEG